MLAISSELKNPTGDGRFFSGVITRSNSPRWIAIAVTLLLHLLFLWLVISGKHSSLRDNSIKTRLQYIEPTVLEKPAPSQRVDPLSINPASTTITLLPLPQLAIQPEPLTQQELRELLGNYDYPSQSDMAGIAKNVFHPELRKQLTDESNKPVLARVEDRGLETYTDPSGATIVVTGSGTCLSSPPAKIGSPRNWYVSTCSGKTESEKIMDRVNEAVNGKLKLERN